MRGGVFLQRRADCDVTLSIPRDLSRFTAIDGVDAIAVKWLASQR